MSQLLHVGAAVEQADADDDKFSWAHRRDLDLDVQIALVARRRRIERFVDAHAERLFLRCPEQGASAPLLAQESGDYAVQRFPQTEVVRLEHRPSNPVLDRLLEE